MKRARLVLAILLLIPLGGAVGAYLWIQFVADRKWSAAQERIRELTKRHPSADARPEGPRPTTAAKETQLHFVAAIREAARTMTNHLEAWNLVETRKDPSSLLEESQEWLDRLHVGGRRCAATPDEFPPRWQGDWDPVTVRYIFNCAVLRARTQRAAGAPMDAAETLLDCLQLGRFWAISGKPRNRTEALSGLTAPMEELFELVSRDRLSPGELQRIERELRPLEGAMHSPLRHLEPMLAEWGAKLAAWDLKDLDWNWAPYRWRYLLPARLMKAEAFEFTDRHVGRMLALEATSPAEACRLWSLVLFDPAVAKNPILERHSFFFTNPGWIELERKAQLRLLLSAARYRAGGELLSLDDPYGGKLHHAASAESLRFWSGGEDGIDGGDDGLFLDVPLRKE